MNITKAMTPFVVSLIIAMPALAQSHTAGNPYPTYSNPYVVNPDLQQIQQRQMEMRQRWEAEQEARRQEAARMMQQQQQQQEARQRQIDEINRRNEAVLAQIRAQQEARRQAAQENLLRMQEEARRLNEQNRQYRWGH